MVYLPTEITEYIYQAFYCLLSLIEIIFLVLIVKIHIQDFRFRMSKRCIFVFIAFTVSQSCLVKQALLYFSLIKIAFMQLRHWRVTIRVDEVTRRALILVSYGEDSCSCLYLHTTILGEAEGNLGELS